jgi:hypothetical protein
VPLLRRTRDRKAKGRRKKMDPVIEGQTVYSYERLLAGLAAGTIASNTAAMLSVVYRFICVTVIDRWPPSAAGRLSARPAIVSRRPAARHRCSGLTEQRSAAGIVVPTAAADCPVSGQRGATCHRGIDAVNGWFAAQPPRARLAASASSAALSFLKTASIASGSRLASSSSPASTSSW